MTDLDQAQQTIQETEADRICRLHVAGKLDAAVAIGMLWMKGYSANDAHWMLCAAKEAS